ncbi:hypothetical protein [Secundilactobacillus malefermentans]|uniref:Uncharacterized protein n=1 Tax=Secundilactobacillus malefermentans TaxID=176292 RepID=A0A4R5NN21_9LACO|nr:hypothetical protein [Secundilactobacillus malefermentans]KRM57330.1 hypothetical protein FD44_GL001203 [Secundilactobacillus malefermentans DSM 5705 = KCTC 3548]QEA31207.1 hypothetical protein FGL90_02940 [Secundilactobacillus malefermentans]TDG77258.1 hypothetical protein C5L31_000694 [Secundilactobacillus malefermentans]
MDHFRVKLITANQARALLKDQKSQRDEPFPELESTGQYILPDYRLTRKREAFKIRRHTFLKRHYKSYVAFDSENGQTLWMHNFASLTEALFWLDTGLKPTDTDSSFTYQDWKTKNTSDIQTIKDQLKVIKEQQPKKIKKRK